MRATKPKIPKAVLANFVDLELKRNKFELSKIETKRSQLKLRNQREVETIHAEGEKVVASLENQIRKQEQEFKLQIMELENQIIEDKLRVEKLLSSQKIKLAKQLNELKESSGNSYQTYKRLQTIEGVQKTFFVKTKQELIE